MDGSRSTHYRVVVVTLIGLWCIMSPAQRWSLDATQTSSVERREAISLADAAIRALQNNLDMSISRYTKEGRLADIVVEQAKFDSTLSVDGRFTRNVDPQAPTRSQKCRSGTRQRPPRDYCRRP